MLLVSPARIGPLSGLADLFDGAEAKSKELGRHYRAIADQTQCHFLDAADVVTPSPVDGVHFDAAGHVLLGRAVADRVREIFGR